MSQPKRFRFNRQFNREKAEEPKRVRWTKQRGDESAAVEKLSKRFTQIFRVPQTEEQAEKSLLFCKTKEQDQKALLRRVLHYQNS